MHRLGLLVVLLVGCPKRGGDVDALADYLTRADAAWEARAQGGLDPVEEILQEAFQIGRTDPRLRWRLARLDVARGMATANTVQAQAAYARARGHGWSCLNRVSGVPELRRSGAIEEALGRVGSDLAPCVAWTGMAWARWRQAAGIAGTIDDDALQEYVAAMPDDPDGLAAWSAAIVDSLYDQTAAVESFDAVVASHPDDAVRQADRLLWVTAVQEPQQLREVGPGFVEQDVSLPEERGAVARVAAALQ